MFNIGDYLEKFKKLSLSRDFLRETTAKVIQGVSGIEIDAKNIEVKDFIARIKEKPAVKAEIFLKKAKILPALKKETQGQVLDIL
jgi:hypothetical protein